MLTRLYVPRSDTKLLSDPLTHNIYIYNDPLHNTVIVTFEMNDIFVVLKTDEGYFVFALILRSIVFCIHTLLYVTQVLKDGKFKTYFRIINHIFCELSAL